MASSNTMKNANSDDFNFEEWISLPEDAGAQAGQINFQTSFGLDGSGTSDITGQPFAPRRYPEHNLDSQYRLQDLPPFDPFQVPFLEAPQLPGSEDYDLATPFQQPPNLDSNGLYTSGLSTTQSQFENELDRHYRLQNISSYKPFDPFTVESPFPGTESLNPPIHSQGFRRTDDHGSPPVPRDMPTQQDFYQGRLESANTSDRPVLQGLVLTDSSKRMVRFFFSYRVSPVPIIVNNFTKGIVF
jgi:hypothetical protein